VATDPDWTCALSADQRRVVFFNRANERSAEAAQTLLAPKPKQIVCAGHRGSNG
jgi:hypothetical protein